jgi:hypothetical protein
MFFGTEGVPPSILTCKIRYVERVGEERREGTGDQTSTTSPWPWYTWAGCSLEDSVTCWYFVRPAGWDSTATQGLLTVAAS